MRACLGRFNRRFLLKVKRKNSSRHCCSPKNTKLFPSNSHLSIKAHPDENILLVLNVPMTTIVTWPVYHLRDRMDLEARGITPNTWNLET